MFLYKFILQTRKIMMLIMWTRDDLNFLKRLKLYYRDRHVKQRLGVNCLCYDDKSTRSFALMKISKSWLIFFFTENFTIKDIQ